MDNIVTPAQAQKELLELIKKANEDRRPVIVKPIKDGEKGVVIVGEDDWRIIQETLSNS